MILKLVVLFCLKLELYSCAAKSGEPGIKIKPSIKFEEITEYKELNAVIGSAVFLPCNPSPPSSEDAILLVLWYRQDLQNPIYTLDSRVPDKVKHFSGRVLESRAHFNMSRWSVAHLKIDPVVEGDEGDYRCRIDYKRGRTLNRFVRLNVIVPVKKMIIKGQGNITYSGIIGPFTEGEELALTCEANGGRPRPQVIWKKGSTILHGSLSTCNNGVVRNELVFDQLRRKDLLSELVCQATNNNLTKPVHESVIIDLNLKPLSIQITSLPGNLKAGDTLELNCQSEGSRPPARITWTKGTDDVNHFAIYNVYGSIAVSSLTILLNAEDNGKNLTCRAQNPHLPESALQDSLYLNVKFRPQLSLVFGANVLDEHIREGSDVYFECNIQANPPITSILWRFNASTLVHSPRNGVELRNNSLLLHSVDRRNRGRYQCVAENALGQGTSEEALLKIQYSPICSPHLQRTYTINRDERINVTCQVEADPPEVAFHWYQNNTGVMLELEDIPTFQQGTTSLLEYHSVMETDRYLTFLCHARNTVGIMKESCVFNIIQAVPPPPLRNCGITNRTTSSLQVSCNQDIPSRRQTYHLEIFDMKGEELLANVTSYQDPTFQVSNLPAESTFVVVLYSSVERRRSDTVALTASTMLSMEKQTVGSSASGSHMTVVILACIGILCTFVVLAFVTGVIVLKSKSSIEVGTMQTEMIEKMPNTTKHNYDDQNTYIYHTSEVPKECLYGDLMDRHREAFETALCKAHSIQEEVFF